MSKDKQTTVHNEEWSGRPSVIIDELVKSVEQKISISELSYEFP
jgi:hypothetical protein